MDAIISRDPVQLAIAASEFIAAQVEANALVTLGLAGGSTPVATHQALANRDLDWSGTTAWIPDERWTDPESVEANQNMARTTLTNRTGIELLAPDTTATDPESAAALYAERVVPMLTSPEYRSIVMLGIGTDGHTASLFPGTNAIDDRSVSYVANFVPQMNTWRLTSTFGLLATSDIVIFVVSGSSKAEVLGSIAQGADLPATRITARERVLWMLDEAAAGHL